MPLSYQVKTSRSHKPCSKLHSFWKHSHVGLGGVGAVTHQGGKLREQPIFKNGKGVYLLPNVKCYRDAHIPENKVPFHVLPRALGFENVSFTLPSWHFKFSSHKWISLMCIINLWGFMVLSQNFYDLGVLCYDHSDLKCLQITNKDMRGL